MLKNYTSEVPASQSLAYIERVLVDMGAQDIVKRYSPEKKVIAVWFNIPRDGKMIPIALPARIEAVMKILMVGRKKVDDNVLARVRDQAERTAWKNVSDWVECQFVMVQLDQVEFLEVFLPYVYDASKQQTLFEHMKSGGFKALPAVGGTGR
jgi:hypothetical protein